MARIIENMPEAEYHARPEVSKHDLDLILKAPALYRDRKDNPEEPDEEMNFGSLVHLAVLEPDRLESAVAYLPKNAPKRPSLRQINAEKKGDATIKSIAFWEEFRESTEGKQIVTVASMDKARGIRDSLYRNPSTAQFLNAIGLREPSLFWEMNGVNCRARLDLLLDGVIPDLKTCGDATRRGFEREIGQRGYHRQGAMYLDAAKAVGRPAKDFVFLAVETVRPYLCTFHILGKTSIEIGRVENQRGLNSYKNAVETGVWSGLNAPYDGQEPIECPIYAL